MQTGDERITRKIFTVSELNANIKSLLEEKFPFIWICGEISNFRVPASGHYYFILKDAGSQIRAVMFRGQQRNLRFEPEDGFSVTGMGRLSVYAPRGVYQVILEYLEPAGIGALQLAFEKLKARLAEEGLFDAKFKKPIPFLPNKISVLTSPTGAVIHDVIKVINRRFDGVQIEIIPTKVQGIEAEKEIVNGIELLNGRPGTDVAILARGGGSLEDLQAFNSETVARAIFASQIPIISAVGHETDYTIADFVADLRAPTPSAAAELVVPEKNELKRRCDELAASLKYKIKHYIGQLKENLTEISHRLRDPRKKIEDLRLCIDDFSCRLHRLMGSYLTVKREHLRWVTTRFSAVTPLAQILKLNERVENNFNNIYKLFVNIIDQKKHKVTALAGRLQALSPLAILERGYSITRTVPAAEIVKDPAAVALNQELEVLVARGSLLCRVKGKSTHGKKNI